MDEKENARVRQLETKLQNLDKKMARTKAALDAAVKREADIKADLGLLQRQRNTVFGEILSASGVSSLEKMEELLAIQKERRAEGGEEISQEEHPSGEGAMP